MFHFIGENLWLTAASLASTHFPENTGFEPCNFIKKCG